MLLAGRPRAKRFGVVDQNVAHPINALQQHHLDPVDARDRHQPAALGSPNEGVGGLEIGRGGGRGHGAGDECDQRVETLR